uniref:Uncharacterized protein n=1 Tax=Setaria viridis TaxID=4556 RepID=A0A4U6TPR6_SETVI|nr:hypothetical protein SEVIR_7G073500v2 [Setaria viridis]
MAEAGALAPAQVPEEAPLDAAAIRSRVEQLSLKRRRRGVEEEAEVADAEVALGLDSAYQVAEEGMDVLDSSTTAISIDDLDAYLERLRKEVSLADEGNRKVSDEIGVTAETTTNDMIRLDVDSEVLESLLSKLESKGFNHFEASPAPGQSDSSSTDSCRNQSIADKDCIYEVLELDQQIGKSKMNLKMLQSLQREVISSPSLGWLIQQCQRCFIINALRRSLVNDANNSRHSFEYFDKEEAIVAHLDRGIDASIKISSDWPLCSYGLKLISLRNSGTHPTNMASSLLSKTKELANGLDLHIRQHLLRFVDAVEEILIRELRSG